MKNSNHSTIRTFGYSLCILGFLFLFTACKKEASQEENTKAETEEVAKVNEIIWNVKVIQPDGQSLDVKAFDSQGKSFDIKEW